MTTRALFLNVVSIVVAGLSTEKAVSHDVRTLCGPRCLQRVLTHFGIKEELHSIILECSMDARSEGMHFDEMAAFLRERKIYSRLVQIRDVEQLATRSPTVALLQPTAVRGYHFVVISPSETVGRIEMWDGLNEVNTVTAEWFNRHMTGYILVTSREDPPNPSAVFRNIASPLWKSHSVALVVVCMCLAIACVTRMRSTCPASRTAKRNVRME